MLEVRWSAIMAVVCATSFANANVPGTSTPLSTATASATQTSPVISGTGVLWTQVTMTDDDIWFRDFSTMNPAIDLTNTPGENEFLEDLDGNLAVWTHNGPSMPGDIVLFDLPSLTATTIASSSPSLHFQSPSVRGRWVVYMRVTTQVDIDGYDTYLGLPFTRPVTNDVALQANPRVSGDVIVYEDYNAGASNSDIVGYHISTSTSFVIASGADSQTQPDLDGDNVVWVDTSSGADQIWTYSISTGATRQLTNSAGHKLQPRISGTRIVWADDRNGNLDIYSYDLSTGIEDMMVGGPGDQMLSDIDGTHVVYTSNDTGFQQIYLFSIATPPPPPPSLPFGCDPSKTDPADVAIVLARPTAKTAFTSRSFNVAQNRDYYLCVQNGIADGSKKTDQMLAVVDGQLVINPSDLKPNNNPPSWVAAKVVDGTTKSATAHSWTVTVYGNRVPSQVTIQPRVAK
jgi:beta propeller repeat protein